MYIIIPLLDIDELLEIRAIIWNEIEDAILVIV
jgi:hypothetical protein